MNGFYMQKEKRKTTSGFTLIELIIAMSLGLIVLGSLYGVFTMQNRTASVQEQIADMQQNARAGLEILMRDIRMAGYNPSKTIPWTSGTAPAITAATANSLSMVADLNGNGNTATDASNLEETITYDLYHDNGVSCLGRTANGTRQPVVEHIESLAFVYYDRDGSALSIPPALSSVRKIQATITARSALPDERYVDPVYGDHYRRYTLTSQVTPRNLGL
jgi:type IV pilus assembly protein PilW